MIQFTGMSSHCEEVEFGTCELCMSTGLLNIESFVFEDTVSGETQTIENGYWSWGDYMDNLYPIENLIDFGHYIKELKIDSFKSFDFKNVYESYIEEVENVRKTGDCLGG